MKTPVSAAATPLVRQRTRNPGAAAPRPRQGRLDGVKKPSRAEQKRGGYKRVELFLGLEAAIALRRLMRDGRSARQVIEALLLDTKRQPGEELAPNTVRLP